MVRNKKNLLKVLILSLVTFFSLSILALADEATSTSPVERETSTSTPETTSVNLKLRYQDILVFDELVVLVKNGTTTITDNTETIHEINSVSALSALAEADATSSAFAISDLAYFSSFDSFLINCIDIAVPNVRACNNWQYVVNDIYPSVGADHYNLEDGDSAFFYFGTSKRFFLSTSTVEINNPVEVTVEKYDYQNDSWLPFSDLTVGATEPDPNNPFSPLEIATSSTNRLGIGIITLVATGTYGIGIAEDFYYPLLSLNVVEASESNSVASTTSATTTDETNDDETAEPPPASGGGGGGGFPIQPPAKVNINLAVNYLLSKQQANGSFGPSLLTDWGAVALAAAPDAGVVAKDKLRTYLISNAPDLSSVTDYERHAMALMALGINPYSGTTVDYIKKITDSFDGTQIGEAGLINDDIFAIFPLWRAGYNDNDEIIKKTLTFIISKQNTNGSFENSVDITSAAIQALSVKPEFTGAAEALTRAKNYLIQNQKDDGGFSNSFSTSWALQAISALGEKGANWRKNNLTPLDYLHTLQQADGGLETILTDELTRLWATEYAIPGTLAKTWIDILSPFPKPAINNDSASGGSSLPLTVVNATSSLVGTTSTEVYVATTTEELEIKNIIATSTKQPKISTQSVKKITESTIKANINKRSAISTTTGKSQVASVGSAFENRGSGIVGYLVSVFESIRRVFSWLFG